MEEDWRGEWDDDAVPRTQFSMSLIASGERPFPSQYIGLIGTTVNWELPAYLSFGCWNGSPCPHEHVAILHYWNSLYQIEILAMTFDTLVCRVRKPVTTRDAALKLASEHLAYCPDNLSTYGTLNEFASLLMNSTFWDFWWD